jgi:hypothetical protein
MAGDSILVNHRCYRAATQAGRETAVDHDVRHKLIESLTSRSWTPLDAEQVSTRVEGVYELEAGEWKVVLLEVAGGEQSVYLVARKVNGPSVFDSPLEAWARDVASVLNEIETENSEPTDAR